MNKPRRHFSGPEKVALLKRHLLEQTPVSDLCDEAAATLRDPTDLSLKERFLCP
jgi:hypothetical protein